MTFEEAVRLKINDTVYTHCGDSVVIKGWRQSFTNPCVKDDLFFDCVDTQLNKLSYKYDQLCGLELCDEDKMFIDWYTNESSKNESIITYLKSAFMNGFQCGYSHKQHTSCEDQLQK